MRPRWLYQEGVVLRHDLQAWSAVSVQAQASKQARQQPTLSKKRFGLLPPNSMVVGIKRSAAKHKGQVSEHRPKQPRRQQPHGTNVAGVQASPFLSRILPVLVAPVNASLAMRSEVAKAAPASGP